MAAVSTVAYLRMLELVDYCHRFVWVSWWFALHTDQDFVHLGSAAKKVFESYQHSVVFADFVESMAMVLGLIDQQEIAVVAVVVDLENLEALSAQ